MLLSFFLCAWPSLALCFFQSFFPTRAVFLNIGRGFYLEWSASGSPSALLCFGSWERFFDRNKESLIQRKILFYMKKIFLIRIPPICREPRPIKYKFCSALRPLRAYCVPHFLKLPPTLPTHHHSPTHPPWKKTQISDGVWDFLIRRARDRKTNQAG